MPKLVGAMKVKDEEFFVERTVKEFIKYIDALVVVDDWSTDRTIEIITEICSANKKPLRVEKAPFKQYHEHSVGNLELQLVHDFKADWCIQLDADDVYEQAFVTKIPLYITLKQTDVIYAGATHMWTTDDNANWCEVNTFRIDSGWVNFWNRNRNIGIQHRRPALFRVYDNLKISGYGRDHGYLCPSQLFNGTKKKIDEEFAFAHFGYATPKLAEKKCIRHGSIPPLTEDERVTGKIYPPDYMPEGFTPAVNIQTFKDHWTSKEGVQLMKFPRKIWS
jgi:glycosyltransferase involved in cell wall biosynthesis